MDPVAIVGVGCRFPLAPNPQAYWQLLAGGVDAITEVPQNRWNIDEYYSADPNERGKMVTRWGGFLDQVDAFDADFFGISRPEAERIDPQQRLMLEVCSEAFEDAGIPSSQLAGSETAVFFGVSHSDYDRLIYRDRDAINGFNGTGSYHSIVANRVSYTFDLKGPSVVVDSACSSSLVALHLACQSLRLGECQLAIVGGVNLNLTPDEIIALTKTGLMSRTGRCRVFDADADGYVRGEGCGVVILQPLAVAHRDAIRIRAVIRGSAVGQDGLTNGLPAPNGLAQQSVMRRALNNARLNPSDVSLVEAHAVGTPLGDAVEFKSIKTIYGESRESENTCFIGSSKANIGHLEAAAGVAGLIKLVLALENRTIPQQINFANPHPYISTADTRLAVPMKSVPWSSPSGVRVAAISAFGFGGTNCHVLVEQAPLSTYAEPKTPWWGEPPFLALSAKSAIALRDLVLRYVYFIEQNPNVRLSDVRRAAALGRTHFKHRGAFFASSRNALVAELRRFAECEFPQKRSDFGVSGAVWLFRGDTTRALNAARELEDVDTAFCELWSVCKRSLALELRGIPQIDGVAAIKMEPVDLSFAQAVAHFAVQARLCQLWKSWGIGAGYGLWEGQGRFSAEYCTGQLSLEDTLQQLLSTYQGECVPSQAVPENTDITAAFRDAESAEQFLRQRKRGFLLEIDSGMEVPTASRDSRWQVPSESSTGDRLMARSLADSLATLYVAGAKVSWSAVYASGHVPHVPLPTYPFQRQRYWHE
jgi:acyl transferase domain-containing protein